VVVTWVLDLSWVRHIGRGSFGPLMCLTLIPWFIGVKVVSFSLTRNTSRSSTIDHTYYVAFLHMGARFGMSFQES
jgi:hypothetical protein